MPKLDIHLDVFTVTETAKRLWRQGPTSSYSATPTPYDEPTLKALIQALVDEINAAVNRAIMQPLENEDNLAHMSVFHPVDGWVPLCKAGMFVSGTCIECTNKAVPK